MPLSLEPSGSLFVIFRKPASRPPPDGILDDVFVDPEPSETMLLEGPWQVAFLDGRGAPGEVIMENLECWTQHSDEGVKYYSGAARYRNRISLTEHFVRRHPTIFLEFERVCDIARITVNGRSFGTLWTQPWRMNIAEALQAGENTIDIEVANRWINRLIGDERFPVDYTYRSQGSVFTLGALETLPDWLYNSDVERTDGRVTFASWKHYSADSPLVASGLLGTVKLKAYSETLGD